MPDRNALGDRGETIFAIIVSTFHGDRPLFRPVSLGSKWPVADLTVELMDRPGMFFLVQVKSSAGRYTKDSQRLQISAGREKLQALADAPLPTYLVGVDEPGEQAFLTAVHGSLGSGRYSISVRYSLREPEVRTRLYEEVREFWEAVRESRPWSTSHFNDVDEER